MQPVDRLQKPSEVGRPVSELLTDEAAPWRVVHAIGALTEPVVGFLIPAVEALNEAGVRQYVLIMNARGQRELIRRDLPSDVPLTIIEEHASLWQRCNDWVAAYRDIQSVGDIDVLHLYGSVPLTLVTAMGGLEQPRRLVCSPMGSWDAHQPNRWRLKASDLLMARLHSLHSGMELPPRAALVDQTAVLGAEKVVAIPPPLPLPFHSISRVPNAKPLVVAAAVGHSKRAAAALSQLGVLAANGARDAPLFQWSGGCGALGSRILKAADIRIYADIHPDERAARLSRAWAFVSPGPDAGFPWHVVEAMACGVPVLALDTLNNRRLIQDGVTGFLCRSTEEMLVPLLKITNRWDLRRSLGDAARRRVMDEFGHEAFVRRLMNIYRMDLSTETLGDALSEPQRLVG